MNTNDLLYHYTSVTGFLGMMDKCTKENPVLTKRATHCMFMNDPSEFKYGATMLGPIIAEVEDKLMTPKWERIGRALNTKGLIHIQSTLKEQFGVPFVSSFTCAKENLPMWNMYADNGKGLMLGFDKNVIDGLGELQVKCKYCRTADELRRHTNTFASIYKRIKHKYVHDDLTDMEKRAGGILLFAMHLSAFLSPTIKHPAYEYEKEYRVAIYKNTQWLYREKNGIIIPYVNTYIPIEALTQIYVGPSADFELVKKSLSVVFADKGIKVGIKQSDIPYRG